MLGFAVGTALYNDKEVLVGMFAFISFYLIDVDSVAIMGLIVDSARIWVGSCFSIFGHSWGHLECILWRFLGHSFFVFFAKYFHNFIIHSEIIISAQLSFQNNYPV